ncbi:serine/threonine-protein kinase pim-2-like [Oratosquilla oratoria]|uniref:serine/threonine-protein kinase pim-2-like n=1 Tax=Oratosquilla oratoria TaxID=337810 RepID=UPI003F76FC02
MAYDLSRGMKSGKNTHWRDRYEVQEPLGKGGFGCVYQARSLVDGTQVAIKEVPLARVGTWGRRKGLRVPMEASLLEKVQSVPGVIKLYECFVSEGNYYMVMELIPKATSLYDYIKKSGKLPLKDTKRLFVDIVKVVQRCLNAGVSHKDIKPENVLLFKDPATGKFKIKLIDFGCGEMVKGYAGRHTGGTAIYWPPEYVNKGEFLHVPATVWSLGTLLYYLVCLDDPFYNEDEIEKAHPPFPKDLPNQCRDLIMKCFSMDPWKRPTLHGILAHPWLRGLGRSKDGDDLDPPDPILFPPEVFKKLRLRKRKIKQKPLAPEKKTIKRGLQGEDETESTPQK